MNLSGTRPWVVAGLVGAFVLLALTWFTIIGPTRSETATLRADEVTVQQQNQVLETQVDRLRTRAEDRETMHSTVDHLLDTLPDDSSLPQLSEQLVQHADARGVVLTSISVAAATTPTLDPAEATPPAGLVAVPITIQSTGRLPDQLAFLEDLRKEGPRAALVTSTSLSAVDDGRAGSVTLTTQFTVFAAPLAADDLAVLRQ